MSSERYLVVNADDLGQSGAVNRGILMAHRNGIVTSASLMVRWPHAAEAATLAKECPGLSIGLHLDLGEWAVTGEEWAPLYQVVSLDDAAAVEGEVKRQLALFEALMRRIPTHLDSHQHVHRGQPLQGIAKQAAQELGIPLRHYSAVQYCGSFYGQGAEGQPLPDAISADGLLRILRDLPEGHTELACHPAAGSDLSTMYSVERVQELQTLCDPRVRSAIDALGICLVPNGAKR
jgi:predicted glycoside hydrolase/deacetylase ChbG (UPF0249 family)